MRGKLDPPCNAVGYIDREVLGINHMYQQPAWRRSEVCFCSDSGYNYLFGDKIYPVKGNLSA